MRRRLSLGESRTGLPLAFFCYGLLAAILLATIMPPFQNPDEQNHFLRAESVLHGQVLGVRFDEGRASGGLASPAVLAAASVWQPLQGNLSRKATMAMRLASRQPWDAPALVPFPNTSLYPPVFYLPSAIGIAVGRVARFDVPRTLVLARVLTGLASGACVLAALVICVRMAMTGVALLIFAVATLPMSLEIQSACSQDGPMLGVTALAVALLAALQGGAAPSRAFLPMCLCLALVAMSRPPYLPLAILPLAAPVRWRARLAGAALIVVATVAWTLLDARFVYVLGAVRPGTNAALQLHTMLTDPGQALAVFAATLRHQTNQILGQIVGRLGWLDVFLPRLLVQSGLALLVLCALACFGGPRRAALLVLAAALLSAVAVVVSQYLTWTPVGATEVEGVQGRYFLPLLVVAAGSATQAGRLGTIARPAALAFPAIAIAVTARVLITRYYLG